jgi:hypothetical protein
MPTAARQTATSPRRAAGGWLPGGAHTGCVPSWVASNLSGEANHQLGPHCQILTPNGMIMKRLRYAGKPRQRSRVGRCGLWQAPVEHGGHVAGGMEFSSGSGYLEVEEWVLTGLGCQSEQMCPQRRPRRLAREFRDDLVGSAIEHLNDLGANQLLGRDMEPVGVTLDSVEQPGSWVAEVSQQRAGRVGESSRARICCKVSVGVRGATASGRITVCGSPSPTTRR